MLQPQITQVFQIYKR